MSLPLFRRNSGLSPCARGNPRIRLVARIRLGSIPVRTGKPVRHEYLCLEGWVYPRAHGETGASSRPFSGSPGLSPCARGNLFSLTTISPFPGSIPVRTGKPHRRGWRAGPAGVYPRAHGETHGKACKPWSLQGLSPCARGNRVREAIRSRRHGSIPVRTGKPRKCCRLSPGPGVYPRAHGETLVDDSRARRDEGLSPCARGNRLNFRQRVLGQGLSPCARGNP